MLERIAGPGAGLIAFAHLELHGEIDGDRLVDAVDRLLRERHELASCFVLRPGGLFVGRGRAAEDAVAVFPAATSTEEIQDFLASQPFELEEGRVCRAGVRIDGCRGAADVIIAAHHAVFDGASDEVALRALMACYDSRSPNGDAPGRRPGTDHADPGSIATRVHRLADTVDLPVVEQVALRELLHRRAAWHSGSARTSHAEVVASARRQRVTPFAVHLAAFGSAVGSVTATRRFAVGIALSRRTEADRDSIGCFVRIVPVRIDLDSPSLVADVWDDLRQAMAAPRLGFSDWGDARRPRNPGRMPLFQACFSYQGWERRAHEVGGVSFTTRPMRELGCHAEHFGEVVLDGTDIHAGFATPDGAAWAQPRAAIATAHADALATLVRGGQ